MMGKDIAVMMRACGFRGGLWYYILTVPLLAAYGPPARYAGSLIDETPPKS